MAVSACGKELVNLLIDNGAIINAKDENGNTPLHLTISRGGADTILEKLLLEKGASFGANFFQSMVNAVNIDNIAPLHSASWRTDDLRVNADDRR